MRYCLCCLLFLSVHCFGQSVDTLDLSQPQDFFYQLQDTAYIFVQTDLDSLDAVSKTPANISYDPQRRIIRCVFTPNPHLEYTFFILRGKDTLAETSVFPVQKASMLAGFNQYNISKILNNSAYHDIQIDSSARGKRLRINGRKIVFEDRADNIFFRYAYQPGVRDFEFAAVEIGADTLVFTTSVRFPGAKTMINARVLILENELSYPVVDITPIKNNRRAPGNKQSKGDDGRPADTLHVYFDTLIGMKPHQAVFAANGGHGQDAPTGTHGVDFPTIIPAATTVSTSKRCDSKLFDRTKNVDVALPADERASSIARLTVHAQFSAEASGKETDRTVYCNYIGTNDQIPFLSDPKFMASTQPELGGKPGEPGKGGTVISNHAIKDLVTVQGGLAGKKDEPRHSGKKSGIANPYALTIRLKEKPHKRYTWEKINLPADLVYEPQAPAKDTAEAGQVILLLDKAQWANIDYIQHTIAYANDLFRFGHVAEAAQIFRTYKQHFFDVPTPHLSEKDQVLKGLLANSTTSALMKIGANLDFYGNNYGFVPGLDVVQNYNTYKSSIENLINAYAAALYLERNLHAEAADYQLAINQVTQYLENNMAIDAAFQKIENEDIPRLKLQLDSATNYLSKISQTIQQLDAAFKREARSIVNARERREKNKGFLRSISTLAKAVPVYQPALGMAASTFDAFVLRENGAGFFNQVSAVAGDYERIRDANKQFNNFSSVLKASINKDDQEPLYKRLYKNRDTLSDALSPYLKNTQALLAGLEQRKVSKQSIEAEIVKLKNKHPKYNKLVDSVGILAAYNGQLITAVSQLTAKLVDIDKTINYNARLISHIKDDLSRSVLPDTSEFADISFLKEELLERLLYQQYHFAKAYEYFTLSQYQGYNETFKLLRRERIETAKDMQGLVENIKTIYLMDANRIAQNSIDILNTDVAQIGKSTRLSITLVQEDIERLNAGGPMAVNFFKKHAYNRVQNELKNYEDFLIEDIHIDASYKPSSVSSFTRDASFSSSNISFNHLGTSTRYHNLELLNFYHYSRGNALHPFYQWSFDMEFKPAFSKTERELDLTYLGLINILTGGAYLPKPRKIISFDSDFILEKTDDHPENQKVDLESLTVYFDLVLLPRKANSGLYVYDLSKNGLPLPITVKHDSTVIQASGTLYRNFKPNAAVDIYVPEVWNGKTFKGWSLDGVNLPAGNELHLQLREKIHKVQPVYL